MAEKAFISITLTSDDMIITVLNETSKQHRISPNQEVNTLMPKTRVENSHGIFMREELKWEGRGCTVSLRRPLPIS